MSVLAWAAVEISSAARAFSSAANHRRHHTALQPAEIKGIRCTARLRKAKTIPACHSAPGWMDDEANSIRSVDMDMLPSFFPSSFDGWQ